MRNVRSAFHIAIFCKAPVAGSVKTRLISAYGADGATAIYVQLAERTLATVRMTCEAHDASASLWVADDLTHETVQRWSKAFNVPTHQQVGTDLGARMLHCLQAMGQQHQRVLLIGTDCPAFTTANLLDAANALTAFCPWVFIPAEDGGYVLVGTNASSAAPFANVAWSSSEVMAQTRARLSNAKLRWAELDALWDVDTADDVLRAKRNGFQLFVATAPDEGVEHTR